MKLIAAIVVLLLMLLPVLTGCNKQIIDLNYKFDRAIISLPNGEVIDGAVQSWKDFEDGSDPSEDRRQDLPHPQCQHYLDC